jgi:four helix bundle protein
MWQKAHAFVLGVYKVTESFPAEEKFGITSQLRRAAVSIPANIAEGFIRIGRPDKARFMNLAQGSANECSYYLLLGKDLGYGISEGLEAQLDEVMKILKAYVDSLRSPLRKP